MINNQNTGQQAFDCQIYKYKAILFSPEFDASGEQPVAMDLFILIKSVLTSIQ